MRGGSTGSKTRGTSSAWARCVGFSWEGLIVVIMIMPDPKACLVVVFRRIFLTTTNHPRHTYDPGGHDDALRRLEPVGRAGEEGRLHAGAHQRAADRAGLVLARGALAKLLMLLLLLLLLLLCFTVCVSSAAPSSRIPDPSPTTRSPTPL